MSNSVLVLLGRGYIYLVGMVAGFTLVKDICSRQQERRHVD